MRKKEDAGQKKPWEKPGDYLKNAEVSAEGNYNMIDGILNNAPPQRDDLTDGQTFDEIKNLAPETLPEARCDTKPSVRGFLQIDDKQCAFSGKKASPRDDVSL